MRPTFPYVSVREGRTIEPGVTPQAKRFGSRWGLDGRLQGAPTYGYCNPHS